jgi:hypothetical protein
MSETNPTSDAPPIAGQAERSIVKRSKLRLAGNLLVQLFLIAILAIIIFVMWLPAIVSKR